MKKHIIIHAYNISTASEYNKYETKIKQTLNRVAEKKRNLITNHKKSLSIHFNASTSTVSDS